MKKLCLIYANCQNKLIAKYLSRSQHFNQEYIIRKFPVHLLMKKGTLIPDDLIQQTKLFIYQPVKDVHGQHSTEYILSKLPENCRCISFASLYFLGYFPQFCKDPKIKTIELNDLSSIIPHGDANIISLLEQNKSVTEITEILSSPDFYSQSVLLDNFNNTLNKLSQRESQLDVKVSSFIKKNYQNYYLFHTKNHPSDILGIQVVNQILKLLNLPILEEEFYNKDLKYNILGSIQVPIYPSVIKHLELKFANNNTVYKHYAYSTCKMTFSRYISEYIELYNSTEESACSYYFKYIKLRRDCKVEQAVIAINKAIELKPDHPTYYKELGHVLAGQNNFCQAEKAYTQAIQLSSDWEEFYRLLGDVLIRQNNWLSGILAYNEGIKLNPNNAEYYQLMGDAFIKLNKLDEAQDFFQKAVKINQKSSYYYRRLGDISKLNNNLDLAIINYRKAIELAPKLEYLYICLSGTLAKLNKFDEAIKYCRQGIDLNPKNPNLHSTLGNIQLQKGNIDKAFASYQQAIQLNPQQMKNIFPQISAVIKEKTSANVYNREPQTVI
jgi:tetratricopeptide (TPR) repeat protein